LGKNAVGPLLFGHLPSAFGIPPEAYSAYEAEDRNMSAIQGWRGLPEHLKPQAALDMLRGLQWNFYGLPVANPGKEELLRWVPESFRQLLGQFETGNQGNLKKTNPAPEKGQIVTPTLARSPPAAVYRSNRDKGRDVVAALRANPAKSNRAIAAMTGTTHPFVAKTRRKLESVTGYVRNMKMLAGQRKSISSRARRRWTEAPM